MYSIWEKETTTTTKTNKMVFKGSWDVALGNLIQWEFSLTMVQQQIWN